MCDGSPSKFCTADAVSGSRPAAKSLFWNILAVSHYGSRFCGDQGVSRDCKLFEINILTNDDKKKQRPFPDCHPEEGGFCPTKDL
jgi:hypothetical protein